MENLTKLMEERERLEKQLEEVNQKIRDYEDPPISALNLSVRAHNSLERRGIKTISQLCSYITNKDPELAMIGNIGKKTSAAIFFSLEQYKKKSNHEPG